MSFMIHIIVLAASFVIFPDDLFAQTNNVLDEIIKLYRDTATSWRGPIMDAATRLFWILVGIDFVWSGIHLALEQADLSKIVAEIIKRIMVIGFYFALLINSGTWSQAILDSFRDLASQTNAASIGIGGGITPSNIFDMGLRIAGALTEQMTFSEIGESIVRAIVSVLILLSFAVIAGLLLTVLIEVYVALNAAMLLLAFGGSRWTSEYAHSYLRFVLATGMKIFVMQLLIGVGQGFIATMNTKFMGDVTHSLVMLGAAVVLCMLVKTVPDYIHSIVSGISPSSAGSALVSGAASAGGAMVGAAAGGAGVATGGVMAVKEAAALAGAKAAAGSSGGGISGIALGTAKNLGGAMLSDFGSKISGSVPHQYGNMGARMAAKMREDRFSMPPPKSHDQNEPSVGEFQKPMDQMPIPRPVHGPDLEVPTTKVPKDLDEVSI